MEKEKGQVTIAVVAINKRGSHVCSAFSALFLPLLVIPILIPMKSCCSTFGDPNISYAMSKLVQYQALGRSSRQF